MGDPEMYAEHDHDDPSPIRPIDTANPVGDLLERAWGLIANAGGGNWETQDPAWIEAAKWWRDTWHTLMVDAPATAGRWRPLMSPEAKAQMRADLVEAADNRKAILDYYRSLNLDSAGLFDLLVQRHMDHTGSCRHVYQLYCAAMGYETPGQFLPPARDSVEEVKAERQRLIELSKRKPGERTTDGGQAGTLVRCQQCGEGLLFQADAQPEPVEPKQPEETPGE